MRHLIKLPIFAVLTLAGCGGESEPTPPAPVANEPPPPSATPAQVIVPPPPPEPQIIYSRDSFTLPGDPSVPSVPPESLKYHLRPPGAPAMPLPPPRGTVIIPAPNLADEPPAPPAPAAPLN